MKSAFVTTVLLFFLFSAASVQARSEPFIFGADISWVQANEDRGQKYSDNGVQKDIILILKDHKFNWIRLRIFVDPTKGYSSQGYCGTEKTLVFSKRIKSAGMKFLLDFHYSDNWADPGKQTKPSAWNNLSFDQLKSTVRSYTKETLEAFKANGTLPDMVQIGNEVVGGMLWPDGKSSNMSNFAALINAGIDGVKDVSSDIRIMVHTLSDKSPSSWLKNLVNAGVKRIDVLGISYYREWHGTPDDLKRNAEEITRNHNVKISVAEYADNHRRVNEIVYNLPDEEGLGTFFWEPQQWGEALFNGTSTNSRIDLFPQLSKEFGNDDFVVAVDDRTLPYEASNEATAGAVWFDRNGVLQFSNAQQSATIFELSTLQGRVVGRWVGGSPQGTVRASRHNAYVISQPRQQSTEKARLLLPCR
ncbi:MAG: glycosyl hydrolase 53 family protein [Chitinispirillaceae bacterium]|nr:glycosyl hydrolase 53 family protein [Chitinispirillaceae bacterium]